MKSAYRLAYSGASNGSILKGSSSFQASPSVWNLLWSLKVPPKLKFFLGGDRVCSNALASKENIWLRKCGSSPLCPRCLLEVETVEHILFRCPFSQVWALLPDIDSSCFPLIVSAVRWFNELVDKVLESSVEDPVITSILMVCWFIWKARNSLIFEKVELLPRVVVSSTLQLISD